MAAETKRQNFNITPEQEAEITWLRDTLRASSTKDAILLAVRVLGLLAREVQRGHALFVGRESGPWTRLLIPELEPAVTGEQDQRQQDHAVGEEVAGGDEVGNRQGRGGDAGRRH